jgi:hypothetical protein
VYGDTAPLYQRGETHAHARLTAGKVAEIRARHAAGGIGYRRLGTEYGVDRCTIRDIVQRVTWRD